MLVVLSLLRAFVVQMVLCVGGAVLFVCWWYSTCCMFLVVLSLLCLFCAFLIVCCWFSFHCLLVAQAFLCVDVDVVVFVVCRWLGQFCVLVVYFFLCVGGMNLIVC